MNCSFTHGPGIDDILGMTVYSQEQENPVDYFFHHDGMGSIVNITDASQFLKTTYTYSPFGEFTTTYNDGTIDSPFTYAGREFSSATGLFHNRARDYIPSLGQFLSRDPYPYDTSSPNTIQRYNYCGNSPVNFVDPWGLAFGTTGNQTFNAMDDEGGGFHSELVPGWKGKFKPPPPCSGLVGRILSWIAKQAAKKVISEHLNDYVMSSAIKDFYAKENLKNFIDNLGMPAPQEVIDAVASIGQPEFDEGKILFEQATRIPGFDFVDLSTDQFDTIPTDIDLTNTTDVALYFGPGSKWYIPPCSGASGRVFEATAGDTTVWCYVEDTDGDGDIDSCRQFPTLEAAQAAGLPMPEWMQEEIASAFQPKFDESQILFEQATRIPGSDFNDYYAGHYDTWNPLYSTPGIVN